MNKMVSDSIEGPLLIEPKIFVDDRGHFLETFNEQRFRELTDTDVSFLQDNESMSHKHVLRGLHFQVDPHAQGKLVRVARGAVLDVVLDIRPGSVTYGQHMKVHLDGISKRMLWVPPGFAHGFVALEDNTVFVYKCTAYYHQPSERTILWNDPKLGIDWGVPTPIVSEKDRNGSPFSSNWSTMPR